MAIGPAFANRRTPGIGESITTDAQARVVELQHHAMQMATTGEADAIGRISYIPDSFVGGPADMYASFQDAMASVLHHGAPSLFITKTANPKWREVRESLPYAQSASDRYDVIARVYAGHRRVDSSRRQAQGRQMTHRHRAMALAAVGSSST